MNLSIKIALRHLKSPQKGSFSSFAGVLAILGLGLGVAALILTFNILEGFESTLSEKIAGFDGHIRVQHFMDLPMVAENTLLDSLLASRPEKVLSTAFIQKPALLRKGPLAEGVIVEGLEFPHQLTSLSDILVKGQINLAPNSIIIGNRLADQLEVNLGDKLVLFDLESLGRISALQRLKQVEVTGLFHSGLMEYDNSIAYISLPDAQDLFSMENEITGEMLTFQELEDVRPVYSYLENRLGYPYYVLSWKDKHRVLFDWMNIQKWPILIIFGMITLVGVVNIISALMMIIFEKVREIGTLLALGLPPKIIRNVFLIEGVVIGSLGSFAGAGLALVLAFSQIKFQIFSIPEDIYFMDHVPVEVNWTATIIIIITGIVISVLASYWPTLKAGRIHPAVALRYE